ncbi:MAG: SMC family ATPase [Chloroflexota bacterium]
MKIISLELENAKSYVHTSIEFAKGMNAIVGHNGAGKSTILEAIGFTLFDSLGYRQNDFVREEAKTAKITVTVTSNFDQRAYQVIRRCGGSSQYMVYDPDLEAKICEGKADVQRFLCEHMGVDPGANLDKLFRDAVGVPQGTLTAAFLMSARERKGIFDPLLQVEEYEKAAKRLLDVRKTLDQQTQELTIEVTRLETNLERLPHTEQNLQKCQQDMAAASQESTMLEAMLQKVVAERTLMDEQAQTLESLRNQHRQTEQELQRMGFEVQRTQTAEAEAQQAETMVTQNQTGAAQYESAQGQQQVLEQRVKARQTMQANLAKLETSTARGQAELTAIEQNLQVVQQAEATIAALAGDVVRQSELESTLQEAQKENALLASEQKRQKTLQNNLQKLQTRFSQISTQLEQTTSLESQLNTLEVTLTQTQANHVALIEAQELCKAEGNTVGQQVKILEQTESDTVNCPICEQPLTPEHRANLLQQTQTRLTQLRADYSQRRKETKAVEKQIASTEQERQQFQQALRNLPRMADLTQVQGELSGMQTELDAQGQRVTQLADAPMRIQSVQASLQQLGNPKQQVAVAQQQVSQGPTLKQNAQRIQASLGQLQDQRLTIEHQLTEFAQLDTLIAENNAKLQQFNAAYQAVLMHRQLASTLAERTVARHQAQQTHTQLQGVAAELADSLKLAEDQFDRAHHQTLIRNEQQCRTQLGALQGQLQFLQREAVRLQGEIEALQSARVSLDKAKARQKQLQRRLEVLEYIRSILRQAGPYVTKALVARISEEAAQIFNEIMQDNSRRLYWHEDYSISLEVGGRMRQFAQLSGGEQMTAALSVRLALLREMSNIDIAFFDEPTTNLDETRRSSLARQILDMRGFNQLFIISHDDTFEQATENLIRVKQVDNVSQVEFGLE